MHVYRKSAGVAVAIVALMLLAALFGHAAAAPPRAGAHASSLSSHSTVPALSQLSTPSSPAHPVTISSSANAAATNLPAAPTAPAAASGPNRMASTISTLRADNVPMRDAFLPNLNANPAATIAPGSVVAPLYSNGAAPIGVAEYGVVNVSGTLEARTLNTSVLAGFFQGTNSICVSLPKGCAPSVLAPDSGTPDAYGLQLNAVLQNVTLFNTGGYEFWTQNVLEYSTYSHQLFIITNVWNFSAAGAGLPANAIAAHGPNGTVVPGEFYYSVAGPFTISSDYTALVALESGLSGNDSAVAFYYDIFNASLIYNGVNDFVVFNSTGAAGPGALVLPQYIASGSQLTPLGIPSDWEFVMGGPGGGSNVDVFSMYSTMDLYYEQPYTHAIRAVPSAYSVGSETGETTYGASALWQYGWSPAFAGPGEYLVPGPTFSTGLWNVTNTSAGVGVLIDELAPSNAFTFFAHTTNPSDYPMYAWAPPSPYYLLAPGTYGMWSMASNYAPDFNTTVIANNSLSVLFIPLFSDPFEGVYTPLWALNQSGVANITWNGYTLFSNEYGPVGYAPDSVRYFPFFGEFNDYAFPLFPGILLWNVAFAQIIAPPAFAVNYPAWEAPFLNYYGLPHSNNLPILIYDSAYVTLANAPLITGWWFTSADFGPAVPQYNVVFWNTSFSTIYNNNFATGGNALYLYGGSENRIFNNTFTQMLPAAPDIFSISGFYFGTYALFEADYGDFAFGGVICGCWDLIANNIFDTYFTALSPLSDPYTGGYPIIPFSEQWNVTRMPGTNIIGGNYLGGNYWWNYGLSENPYGVLPYENYQYYYTLLWGLDPFGIYWLGDFLPLTPTPVYTVNFVEVGLPAGSLWTPEVQTADGGWVLNYTNGTYANESWPAGFYNLSAYTTTAHYTYVGYTLLYVGGNETVLLDFGPLYVLSFAETGLPVGGEWEVELETPTGFVTNFSTTEWINFSEPAGNYSYDAFSFDYYGTLHGFGNLNLTGNDTVVIPFLAEYSVGFDETGLPLNQSWTVIFQVSGIVNVSGSATTNGSSLLLGYGPAGLTVDWQASSPGYVGSPASGSFTLTANTTVTVSFLAAETVTFDESGLAAGAAWTVSFTQGASTQTQTSLGPSMTFDGVAGAFSYTVSAAGYVPTHGSGSGTLPVGGPIDVTFSPAPTTVVFDETGLPVSEAWTVHFTQNGTTTVHTGTGDLSFGAVFGAFNYSVYAANFSATPNSSSGTLPANSPVTIAFSPTPITMEFDESGLPAGTLWTVYLTQGSTTTGYTGTGTIDVPAVYGDFSYRVGTANYTATPASGSGVLPADATVSVTFAIHDGTLTGTVLPATGTMTVGGAPVTLGGAGGYTLNLAPGTHAVVVSASGFYPYYANVTVAAGKTTHLNVTLQAIPSNPTPLLGVKGSTGWLLIGALAALALILLGTTLLFMSRSRRPPQMTQYTGTAPPASAAGTPEWSESGPGTPPPGSR